MDSVAADFLRLECLMPSPVKSAPKEKLLNRWLEHPSSAILHHDHDCCNEARLWFLAYARSMEIGSMPEVTLRAPTWLQHMFSWGPSEWPIFWCEVVQEDVVDCGVFAALAREIFALRGHQVHPAQALLSFSEECTRHWRGLWDLQDRDIDAGKVFPWIGERMVYHEICVLETAEGEARFYDSTWGHWLQPHQKTGQGAILAVRSECPRILRWGDRVVSFGEWVSP